MKRRDAPFFCLALCLALPHALEAQYIRVTGSSSVRYIELRPMVRDSVSVEHTLGTGLMRQTPEGRVVRCVPEDPFCRDTRPGDAVYVLPAIQDLEVSAWGFGEGVRLFTHLRGRTASGGSPDIWPRAEESLDILAAYGELDRSRFRLRAGRQWTVSGLGFYNFDGLALALRPAAGITVEGYAGRSLVRGLNEPRAGGALESIEALAPERPGLLLGMQARYRPLSQLALSALYQVDFRDDRRGHYSELAAANGTFRVAGSSLEGSVEADVATGALNEARLRVRSPPVRRMAFHAEARRYRPYFELWTIWGAFSPIGFDEGRVGMVWAEPGGGVILRAEAAYRSYGDSGVSGGFGEFRTEGWGLGANASWAPQRAWRIEGGYRAENGFGGGRHDGQVGVLRQLGDVGSAALQAVAFQRLYEFRLDEGTVLGLGAEANLRVSDRVRLFGSAATYRHLRAGPTSGMDWNQRRGSLRVQWTLGPEPGFLRSAGAGP
jgi:hypothetical protein